jgi:hypothetical protein
MTSIMGELWQDACQAGIQLVSSENTSLSCLPGGVDLPLGAELKTSATDSAIRGV